VSGALTLLSFAEGNTEGVSGKDRATAERIAVLLPANHRAVGWVLGGCAGKFMNDLLDDLGDPLSVEQVLHFMKPKTE
jgi:hypothetical protein